jgi:sulfite reductase (NADPH) hemoprotein beta-component
LYRYDEFDRRFLEERTAQYRDQVRRRLNGELSEEEFRPLRLRSGLYLQLHAYMYRIAIPYGTLSPAQLRMLAHIARKYDRGYGHFTTRQNMQFNWIKLDETPDIMADLASVEMHSIQTSGNCIRNTTSDPFAGVTADELEDPRPYCEIIRQWSTLHPEFSWLPRKFKIAVSASETDRAAVHIHDIGLYIVKNAEGELGFQVLVGGGLGRTPIMGKVLREFLPKKDLLSYLEAALRVYNEHGRRDNIYKARIKILVQALGIDRMRAEVEAEWAQMDHAPLDVSEATIAAIYAHFAPPAYPAPAADGDAVLAKAVAADAKFARWVKYNTHPHKQPGYSIVTVSLKPLGKPPGDVTADQMDLLADLSERYGFGETRVTHEQNIVFPDVRTADLPAFHAEIAAAGMGTANAGLASDMIACPGLDYCSLANARSIPVAESLGEHLAAREEEIGPLKIKISGCINACGHHHVGHIGILGVDKNGEEFYQITVGGSADAQAAVGTIVGRAVPSEGVNDAIDKLVDVYLAHRADGEDLPATYRRIGAEPFKEAVYGAR